VTWYPTPNRAQSDAMRPLPRPKVWVIESDAARLLFINAKSIAELSESGIIPT